MIREDPPRWLQRALVHVLNARDLDTISGDLLEEFRDEKLPRLASCEQTFGICAN